MLHSKFTLLKMFKIFLPDYRFKISEMKKYFLKNGLKNKFQIATYRN